MPYEILIAKVGECDVRGPEVYWMSHWDAWETLNFYMLVVRGDGRTVVINTGPPEELAELNRRWVGYIGDERAALRRTDAEQPASQLRRLGVEPAQVDCVLLTPFQPYTVANVALFPNAAICVSRTGWAAYHAPKHRTSHAERSNAIPDSVLHYLCTEAWDRVRLLEDEDEPASGIRTFHSGAHHPESLGILIETGAGTVAYSDSIFKYPNLEENRLLGIAENLDACRTTYARIRREADIVIAGYDPAVLKRFPSGRVG